MKGNLLFVLLILLMLDVNYSQSLYWEENFDYEEGVLTELSADWDTATGTSVPIEVVEGSLTYTDYPSSGIGNKIVLNGGAAGRQGIYREFSPTFEEGNSVYASFLLNVTSTDDMDLENSNGDYFVNFDGSAIKSRVVVRKGSSNDKYSIGLAKTTHPSSLIWHNDELDVGTTYLIVIAYLFVSGSSNDIVKFWINPDLSGVEPEATLEYNSGADADSLYQFQLRQKENSGHMEIDDIRISDSWGQAPLPVELTSFTTEYDNNEVTLTWQTATEVNNYGFDIERKLNLQGQDSDNESDLEDYTKIGFVQGHGTTNSPKSYSFTDNLNLDLNLNQVYYRLKQIDIDGTYSYSKVVGIDLSTITGTEDEEIEFKFKLNQNYPNPFNPMTSIEYQVSRREMVTLKVYDTLGNEISTLVNREIAPGKYRVKFNAENLSSGIYYYRLQAGVFSQVKKLIILK